MSVNIYITYSINLGIKTDWGKQIQCNLGRFLVNLKQQRYLLKCLKCDAPKGHCIINSLSKSNLAETFLQLKFCDSRINR